MKTTCNDVNRRALRLNHDFCRRWLPLMTLENLFEAFSPYFNLIVSAMLLNEIGGSKNPHTLFWLVALLVVGNFVLTVANRTSEKFLSQAVNERERNESRSLALKTMQLDYGTVEGTAFRQLRRRVDENAKMNGNGKWALLNAMDSIEYNIFNLLVAIYLFTDMLVHIWSDGFDPLCLLFLALIAALAMVNIVVSNWRQKKETEMVNKGAVMMTDENRYDDAIDSYHMGKDARIYRQDRKILSMKEKYLITDHVKHFTWMFRKVFRYSILTIGIAYLLKFSIYAFIVYYVIQGRVEIGGLIKYVGFVEMFSSSVTRLVTRIALVKDNTPYVADYIQQFEFEPVEQDRGERLGDFAAVSAIEFVDVSFRYPESERYIFRHLSFRIQGGEKVAIVGMNGSGKTTIVKLLCRLYKPTEGKFLVNGRDIWDIAYTEYISLIAAVFQDFKLFSFSLAQNVALNDPYDTQKAAACLERAGLSKRIADMPHGLDTALYKDFEEDGVEISGGEAQKIAIARALYKDAPVVILDEPTSALDPLSEYDIYSRFDELVQDKLAIYISHRLSSCRFCDDILVMDAGQLVQRGRHDTLLQNAAGKYYELWQAQARFYQPDVAENKKLSILNQ